MENIEAFIKRTEAKLQVKLEELNKLEEEKAKILAEAKNIKSEDLPKLLEKMALSEAKFKSLCDEILLISYEVQKVKKSV